MDSQRKDISPGIEHQHGFYEPDLAQLWDHDTDIGESIISTSQDSYSRRIQEVPQTQHDNGPSYGKNPLRGGPGNTIQGGFSLPDLRASLPLMEQREDEARENQRAIVVRKASNCMPSRGSPLLRRKIATSDRTPGRWPVAPKNIPPQKHKPWAHSGEKTSKRLPQLAPPRDDRWAKFPAFHTKPAREGSKQRAAENAEVQKYLDPAISVRDAPAIGFFIWPNRYEEPVDLLGKDMALMIQIKVRFQVQIGWDEEKRYFLVSSASLGGAKDVASAISTLRRVVSHAKALVASAPALHLVCPPTLKTIRTSIIPILHPESPTQGPKVVGFALDGAYFTETRRLAWAVERTELQACNRKALQEYLTEQFTNLSAIRDRMRLRLHFGNLQLWVLPREFVQGKLDFHAFCAMLSSPNLSTTFTKQINDGKIALSIRDRMMQHTERLCAYNPKNAGRSVIAKHTLLVYATSTKTGMQYIVEAEIDVVDPVDQAVSGQYQMGVVRYYMNNQGNKHLEMVNVDIAKGIDWTLEVTTNRAACTIPQGIIELVKDAITPRTRQREDTLGVTYPAVEINCQPHYRVKNTALRSAFQLMSKKTAIVTEVSVHREWAGVFIQAEPKITTSVSMFGGHWDTAMDTWQDLDEPRNWDSRLQSFFPDGEDGKDGVEIFLEEVEWVHDFLARTTKGSKANSVPVLGADA